MSSEVTFETLCVAENKKNWKSYNKDLRVWELSSKSFEESFSVRNVCKKYDEVSRKFKPWGTFEESSESNSSDS